MPIARVREYVELARAGDGTVEQRLELLQQHRLEVLAHLEETRASLAAIDYKTATYKNRIDGQ